MDKINERLIEVVNEKKLTPYRIAKDLGLSTTATVANWVKGRKKGKERVYFTPKTDTLLEICKLYEINSEWLLSGKGNMNTNKTGVSMNKADETDIVAQAAKIKMLEQEVDFLKSILTNLTKKSP